MYEPELDFDLLSDWRAFCDGTQEFPYFHFSTILMGVFIGGLTPEVDRFLQAFTQSFSQPLYGNLIRICGDAEPDRNVLPWIQRDLDEKRKLLDSSTEAGDVRQVIDGRHFAFTHDFDAFRDVQASSANHSVLYQAVDDFMSEQCEGDTRLFALQEALYHIATSSLVAASIMAPLLEAEVNLGHYFEIYLRGGDYVLDNEQILVYTHQPAKAASV